MKKKKPKKTAWEETVKPESPGLWMVKFGGGAYSDEELVEQAEKHLLELLRNPYYYEAYQRLHKKLPPRRPGRLPSQGAIAKNLQYPESEPNRKDNKLLDLIARIEDDYRLMQAQVNALIAAKGEFKGTFTMKKRINICRDLVGSRRDIIQEMWPYTRGTEALAQRLATAVGNYRRGRY